MEIKPVDLICQHSADGTIIPLRVRFNDEDGESQTFNIKDYEDLSHQGTRTMPDGVFVTNNTIVFQCKIIVFNAVRVINLYLDKDDMIWKMSVIR